MEILTMARTSKRWSYREGSIKMMIKLRDIGESEPYREKVVRDALTMSTDMLDMFVKKDMLACVGLVLRSGTWCKMECSQSCLPAFLLSCIHAPSATISYHHNIQIQLVFDLASGERKQKKTMVDWNWNVQLETTKDTSTARVLTCAWKCHKTVTD